MDVSYSSRATTSWLDNYGDDSDYYYAELEKRMLQLMREDDDDEDYKRLVESHAKQAASYRENYSMQAVSFPAETWPPQGGGDPMKNVVYFQNWQPLLPANGYGMESGSGTGVFIPLPSKRKVPSGTAKRSKGRLEKRSEESTNN